MREETIGKLVRAIGAVILDPQFRRALDPKAQMLCLTAFLEAVRQLPIEGQQLLLDSARKAGLI